MAERETHEHLLDGAIDKIGAKFESLLGERDNAQAEHKAEVDKRLGDVETTLKELREEQRDHLKRVSLPGVEWDEDGHKSGQGFSIYRAVQLAMAEANPNSAFGQFLEAKSHGYEREVQKHFEGVERTYNVGTDQAGGVFVPQEVLFDSIIPQLEASAVLRQAGATSITGLRGDLTWPVEEGTTTTYYIDTEGEEEITESTETFSTKSARPRTLAAMQKLSHKMMLQSGIGLEGWINRRFGIRFGLREDLSGMEGSGSAGQPLGLVNVSDVLNTTQLDSLSTAAAATAGLSAFMYEIKNVDAWDPAGNWAFVMTPDVAGGYHGAVDGDGRALFRDRSEPLLNSLGGYPVYTSTQFNSGATFLAFGDWSKLLFLTWGGLSIRATEEGEDARRLRMSIIGHMDHDVLVEQPKAFNFTTGADITPTS